jgi:hypothetical protein
MHIGHLHSDRSAFVRAVFRRIELLEMVAVVRSESPNAAGRRTMDALDE